MGTTHPSSPLPTEGHEWLQGKLAIEQGGPCPGKHQCPLPGKGVRVHSEGLQQQDANTVMERWAEEPMPTGTVLGLYISSPILKQSYT